MERNADSLLVSIRCLAFNHKPYIRQCLDGFVMQKTNFRFEAVIHDDASTDGTTEIIREFAEKYPTIIKPIYEVENQYSKHDGSLRKIVNAHIHGKYVALCEGDDYWTDASKLQKQVDFLESHDDYSMCFHSAIQHIEGDVSSGEVSWAKQDKLFSIIKDREYSGNEIYQKWIVPTASVVMRRSVFFSQLYVEKVVSNKFFIVGDSPLFLTCASYGKIYGMSDVMSVYRRHAKGAVISQQKYPVANLYRILNHHFEIVNVFGKSYQKSSLIHTVPMSLAIFIKTKFSDKKHLISYLKTYPLLTTFYIIKYVTNLLLFKMKGIIFGCLSKCRRNDELQ